MAKKGFLFLIAFILVLGVPVSVFANGGADASSQKEIEIRWASIWVGADSKAVTVTKLVEEFNAANAGKIKVVIEPQPDYNAYEQKVRTSLAAGTAPADIFTIKLNPTTAEFYNSKLLMDFKKSFNSKWEATFDEGPSLRNRDPPHLVQHGSARESRRLRPAQDHRRTLVGLRQAQGRGNLSRQPDDRRHQRMDHHDLVFALRRLARRTESLVEALHRSRLRAVRESRQAHDQRLFAIGLGAGGSGGHFLAGRTAMFSNGPWYAGRADLAATPFFKNITIAALPPAGKTKNYMISRMQANICAGATKDPAREEAILGFLKFLTSPVNVKRLAEASGAMFAVKTDAQPANHLQSQFNALANSVTVTAPDLEAALGAEATLEFTQMLSAFALDKISAEEFVKAVSQKIDQD